MNLVLNYYECFRFPHLLLISCIFDSITTFGYLSCDFIIIFMRCLNNIYKFPIRLYEHNYGNVFLGHQNII